MVDMIDRVARWITLGISVGDCHEAMISDGLSEVQAWYTWTAAQIIARDRAEWYASKKVA